MKKVIIPISLSLIILVVSKLASFENPILYFTNDFYLKAYHILNENTGKGISEIAIVNISDLPTESIKKQIEIISQYSPATIAVDYFYDSADFVKEKIQFTKIVLPIWIYDNDSVQYPVNCFSYHAEFGYIRVYSTVEFQPFIKINGTNYSSLPTKVIQLYDSALYNKLLMRKNQKEVINYLGNIQHFQYLGDLSEITSIEILRSLKNKIVLVGYTGIDSPYPSDTDFYDAHLTPKGKMFGVVLLANIIHTLMNNYIDPLNVFWTILIICTITYFNALISHSLRNVRYNYWLIKFLQLVQVILLFIIAIAVLRDLNLYIDYEFMCTGLIVSPEVSYWYFYRKILILLVKPIQ